jgi:uncharacterized protein YutE (UPF0331/DUF86 family)
VPAHEVSGGRPPVAAKARRSAFDDALGQLARTMAQLESAVAAFQPDPPDPQGGGGDRGRGEPGASAFDLSAFDAAWYSKDPRERNRAMLVRSNMDDLYNLSQTLIGLAIRVAQDAGAIPADRKTPAADQLRAQQMYPKDAEEVMLEVAELRNRSQHEYWILGPSDIHGAVNRQRQHLPVFIAGVGAWIEGLPE